MRYVVYLWFVQRYPQRLSLQRAAPKHRVRRRRGMSRFVTVLTIAAIITSPGNGDRKASRSDGTGIISPGFFMTLRDADFHEHVSRTEDPNTVTQTPAPYAGPPPHFHPQSISSYKFKSLVRTISDKHFELTESDRKQSQRHPNRFHKHYGNIKRRITQLPAIF